MPLCHLAIKMTFWCLLGVSLMVVCQGFGYDINLQYAIIAVSISAIAGGLSLLPGGIGTTDLSLYGFCLLFQVSAADALLIVFFYRLISFWYLILLGQLGAQYLMKTKSIKNINI